MIQSMTGFGKATAELPNRKITVEIKSLNSKQFDLSVRMPSLYKENEMAVRNLLARKLERGKIDFLVFIENIGKESSQQINHAIVESYYTQIKESANKLGIDTPSDWFQTILRLPDVIIRQETQEIDEQEWQTVSDTIDRAIEQLIEFRKQEGAMLKSLFIDKIANINKLLQNIEPYELERVDKVKARISEALQKIEDFDYDKNRFEQEMIYHIEKLDINEEKARLANHLTYFIETMDSLQGQGKKLGFIAQEIGREVNTMGSKSNHAQMQQIVVEMKDELEQIKEQVLNVL